METPSQQQDFERFRELVLGDRGLHDQLRGTPNEPAFIDLAVRLAARTGMRSH